MSANLGSVIALSAIFKVVTHLSANKLEVIEPDIKVLEASNKEKEFAPTFNLILLLVGSDHIAPIDIAVLSATNGSVTIRALLSIMTFSLIFFIPSAVYILLSIYLAASRCVLICTARQASYIIIL